MVRNLLNAILLLLLAAVLYSCAESMGSSKDCSAEFETAEMMVEEALFLQMYPKGFEDEGLREVSKKHNVVKLSEFAATALAKKRFAMPGAVLDDIVKIVTRSSMISMFEKPRFRDYVTGLSRSDRDYLTEGYRKLLLKPGAGRAQRGEAGQMEPHDDLLLSIPAAQRRVCQTDHHQRRHSAFRTAWAGVQTPAQLGVLHSLS